MPSRFVQRALLFGAAGIFLGYISRLTLVNNDMFHAMSLFRETLTEGWVPTRDVYAFTPTVEPTVHHEWATGAVWYLVTVAAGWGATGLMLLKYLVTGGIAAGCYGCARRRGASSGLFAVLSLLMLPIAWVGFGTMRAQLFTLLFLTGLLLLLEEDHRGRKWWIAAWLPLYIVWLNMHAGFVVGVGILGLHSIESFGRVWAEQRSLPAAFARVGHLLGTLALMIPCLWINPYGHEYVGYLWHGLRMERPLISEWAPLWHTVQPLLTIELFLISVGLIAYSAYRRGPGQVRGLLLLGVTALLALKHTRHGSIYAIVWLSYIPAALEGTEWGSWFAGLLERRRREAAVAALLAGCLGLAFAASNRCWELTILTHADQEPLVYPAGAVDYLAEAGFHGNLIVPFNTGAYVSWKLYPAVKVSFDSRYEATYPPGALEENFDFYAARSGWRDTLQRHGADSVLVRRISPVDALLETTCRPDWKRVYVDDAYSLFVRTEQAEALPVVDRQGLKIVGNFP